MDEDVLERDEVLNVMLRSIERRVEVSNSTTVVILNDDGEFALFHNTTIQKVRARSCLGILSH